MILKNFNMYDSEDFNSYFFAEERIELIFNGNQFIVVNYTGNQSYVIYGQEVRMILYKINYHEKINVYEFIMQLLNKDFEVANRYFNEIHLENRIIDKPAKRDALEFELDVLELIY